MLGAITRFSKELQSVLLNFLADEIEVELFYENEKDGFINGEEKKRYFMRFTFRHSFGLLIGLLFFSYINTVTECDHNSDVITFSSSFLILSGVKRMNKWPKK